MADQTRAEAELERLQAENAELRTRNEELAAARAEAASAAPARSAGWRWPLTIALLTVGGLALAGAVAAIWANRTLLDTDRYTETVAPLAEEPAIRESVSVASVDALFAEADVETRAREALPPEADFLAAPLTSELRSLALETSERALASPQFDRLWVEANRRTHEAVLPFLKGESGPRGFVDTGSGTVSLDVQRIVVSVKDALVERGITIVEQVPDDVAGTEMVLFQSGALADVQRYVSILGQLAVVLPVLALLAIAGAVLTAPDRRRGLLWAGVTTVVAMVVLGAVVGLLRSYYVDSVDRAVLNAEAAAVFFDVMVRFLRNAVRTMAAIGAVVVIGAALAGPSRAAVAVRGGVTRGMAGVSSALGLDLGPFSEWVARHRRALDIAVLLLIAAILLAAEAPTPGLVFGLAIAAVLGVALVEFLGSAHGPPPGRPVT